MPTLSQWKIRTAAVAAALSLACASAALHAQMPAPRSQMNVPFDFQIGSTRLAAGTYILSNPQHVLLSIQGQAGSTLALSQSELSIIPSKISKVVFHRYGKQYFLREVWLRDGNEYLTCPESKAEREIERAQKLIQQASTPATANVEVALLQPSR